MRMGGPFCFKFKCISYYIKYKMFKRARKHENNSKTTLCTKTSCTYLFKATTHRPTPDLASQMSFLLTFKNNQPGNIQIALDQRDSRTQIAPHSLLSFQAVKRSHLSFVFGLLIIQLIILTSLSIVL